MAALGAIRANLTPEERRQFDADLWEWNRYYAEGLQQLVESAGWKEIEQWRACMLSVATGTQVA